MTINEIQMLQYMLSCFDEYMKVKKLEIKNYKVVFKLRNHLLTGDLYDTNQYHEPVRRILNQNGEISQSTPTFDSESKTDIIVIARHTFYKTFDRGMFSNPSIEYKTPHLLLPHLINLITDLNINELDNYGTTIFNPHFLDLEIELPFINISSDERLEPITLVSEN